MLVIDRLKLIQYYHVLGYSLQESIILSFILIPSPSVEVTGWGQIKWGVGKWGH